jgi:hypothetical protein
VVGHGGNGEGIVHAEQALNDDEGNDNGDGLGEIGASGKGKGKEGVNHEKVLGREASTPFFDGGQ